MSTTAALVERARRDDRAAFEALLALHGRTLLAVARAGTRNSVDAEEVFQESTMRIWRSLASLESGDRFVAWSCSVVQHAARDRARREKVRRAAPLMDRPAPPASGPSEQRRRRIVDAVRAMPAPLAEVIELFYFGGLSYAEIANAIDMSVPTVNSRLTKARALLRRTLEQEDPNHD